MSYWVNKIVWVLVNPLDICIFAAVIGFWLIWNSRGREEKALWGFRLIWAAMIGLLVASLPIVGYILGYGLECNYEECDPKDVPAGDVALDLGGSWRRAWYAAELVKAKRAGVLIASGVEIDRVDAKLIRNLGVEEPTLILDTEARNTEENIRNAKRIYEGWAKANAGNERPRVLVVTTAVHMPRSMLLMQKYWPEAEAIPAPTEFMVRRKDSKGIDWDSFVPSLYALEYNLAFYHEYLGCAAYKWLK